MANNLIPAAAAMPQRARTEVGTISRNAMLEPRLDTRKGNCLKNSDTRRDGNIPRTYIPHTLAYGNSVLVSSFDFTAALMIYRFMPSACFLPTSCITLFSVTCKVYTRVFFPQGKENKPVFPTLLNSCIWSLAILQASAHSNFSLPLHFHGSLISFAIGA